MITLSGFAYLSGFDTTNEQITIICGNNLWYETVYNRSLLINFNAMVFCFNKDGIFCLSSIEQRTHNTELGLFYPPPPPPGSCVSARLNPPPPPRRASSNHVLLQPRYRHLGFFSLLLLLLLFCLPSNRQRNRQTPLKFSSEPLEIFVTSHSVYVSI